MCEKYIEYQRCRDCNKLKEVNEENFTVSREKLTNLCQCCASDRRVAVLRHAKEKYDSVSHENDYRKCTKCGESKLNTEEFFTTKCDYSHE